MNLLTLFAGRGTLIAGSLVIAGLAAALGAQTLRLASSRTQLAEQGAQFARQREAAAEDALTASAAYRKVEQELARTKEEINDALTETRNRNEAAAASLRADNVQLRNALAAYAAGSGGPAADSITACQSRAATLGGLLEEGLRLQVDLAEGAEDHLAYASKLLEWGRAVESHLGVAAAPPLH